MGDFQSRIALESIHFQRWIHGTSQAAFEKGILVGSSTSRGEQNASSFIEEIQPDVLIVSGGALVKYKGETVYRAMFTKEETKLLIAAAREVCGADCEITIDTADSHYWNYKSD